MATRLYFPSSGAAAVTPSTWEFPSVAAVPSTYAGVVGTPSDTVMTTENTVTTATNPEFKAQARWVYGPLDTQTISGNVKGQMRCMENNEGANATLALAIKIIQPDGTDRATLLAETASDDAATRPPEMVVTTYTNRKFRNAAESASIALTSQNATAGDYLVVEIGFYDASTQIRTINWSFGDETTGTNDLAEDDTTTTADRPWLEFDTDLDFDIASTGQPISKRFGGVPGMGPRRRGTFGGGYFG